MWIIQVIGIQEYAYYYPKHEDKKIHEMSSYKNASRMLLSLLKHGN